MNTNLISISGRMGSGKDTAGKLIQDILETNVGPFWDIKKFATGLKQLASIILNVSPGQFEDQKFKESYLPAEWNKHKAIFSDRADFHGWEVETVPMTVREFLQKLGTDAMRDGLHQNVWVNMLMNEYEKLKHQVPHAKSNFPRWIITDTRFPNEYEALRERNALFIKINRPGLTFNDHPSETSLDNHKFDYVVENSGDIYHLQQELRDILIAEDYM